MKFDLRDWLVGVLVAAMWTFACVFLWRHADDANFVTWAAVCGTMTCVYHWLNIKDG